MLSEEEKEAIESVKSMFGDITIEKLIKDKIFNITICSLGILDILRVIAIVDNLQKEIEEKSTIIMAGAEKVKQLEKAKNKNCISKEKIREWLDRFELEEELQDKYDEFLGSQAIYKFLKKLLEENNNE